ncbi:M12 family metallopeptidase [Pseudomonas veronii]|uniref:M12 family metallopeptidase n=1 Tax=Pseudomonas TaxID=286 RepID=UPI0018665485|nr:MULTISPECIES: M12 family metallopeptidase [Pseudomonas]UHH31465.1 M12 family metallopeptidase [Pseudomonas veronii]WKC45844.1 M12 family metallopeptidase [Pseudomonas veronii]
MSLITPPLAPPPAYEPLPNNHTSPPESAGRTKRGIADSDKRWPAGVVTVALDLSSEKSKALVVDAIREWAHHTPALRFNIVEGKTGDIRISDDEGLKGNWSAIGTEAKRIDEDQPTMHLNRTDDSKKLRSTALHEFGHALGLLHEHQHPQNSLDWDSPQVYDYYTSDSFNEAMVREHILEPDNRPGLQITPYDPQSVMHYEIPAALRRNGQAIPKNTTLSAGDKQTIRMLYPPVNPT